MARWPVLTACALGCLAAGCTPSFTPGFANAPRLGGSAIADEHVRDVVSNGDDACRLGSEGTALRNKVPPCPTVEATTYAHLAHVSRDPENDAIVVRWLRHFYVGWPCKTGSTRTGDVEAVAWMTPSSTTTCRP